MNPRPVIALLGVLTLLSGCMGDHKKTARPGGDEGPHLAVPFYADRRDQWGPAALASVLSYWNKPAAPAELRKEVHFPKQPGSLALDLKYAARARGLEAEMYTGGNLRMLKQDLDEGRPVIVLVNIGFGWLPVRSYMVVTGYNEWLRGVYAHFGPNKDFFLSYSQFEEDWKKAGGWFLRVSEKRPQPRTPPEPVAAGYRAAPSDGGPLSRD